MKKKKFFITIAVMFILTFAVGTLCYATAYPYSVQCFHNQHVQSGYECVSYYSFTPTTNGEVVMNFDADELIYTTGEFRVGIKKVDSNGNTITPAVSFDTVTVTSTSQNLDEMYYHTLSARQTYKAFIYGYNGVHFIVDDVIVYYN